MGKTENVRWHTLRLGGKRTATPEQAAGRKRITLISANRPGARHRTMHDNDHELRLHFLLDYSRNTLIC
jgi:hypothetical protein